MPKTKRSTQRNPLLDQELISAVKRAEIDEVRRLMPPSLPICAPMFSTKGLVASQVLLFICKRLVSSCCGGIDWTGYTRRPALTLPSPPGEGTVQGRALRISN